MNKYILYIALSGLFGLSSILSDQYAYQIEKSIVNLEAEKKSFEHQRAESENIKNLLIGLSRFIDKNYMGISLEHAERMKREEKFELLPRDLSNLDIIQMQLEDSIEFASQSEYLKNIISDNFENKLLSRSKMTSLREKFDEDMENLIMFNVEVRISISNAATLSSKSSKEIDILFSRIPNLRFSRQAAIIIAISSSLLSLMFLFIFFRIFLDNSTATKNFSSE